MNVAAATVIDRTVLEPWLHTKLADWHRLLTRNLTTDRDVLRLGARSSSASAIA
jgi:hypothetical protein